MKEYTFDEYKKFVSKDLNNTPDIHFIYQVIYETSHSTYKNENTDQYLVKRRKEEDTLPGNERQSWVLFHDYLQRSINEIIRPNFIKELERLNIFTTWSRARSSGCAKKNIDVYIGININIRNITVCELLADFLDYCDRHNVQHPVFDIDKLSEQPEGWSVDEVLEKYRQSDLPYQKPYVARYALKELEVSTPYKGLSSFTVADSKFFFGRDEDIGNIRRKIEKRPFVAVLGSSGSGKSSVVHGGVIPSLPKPPQSSEPEAKSGWSCITFKPSLSSQNPFLALAEVLYRDIPSERFQDGDDKKAVIEDKLKNASEATASKWLIDYLEDIQKHKNSSYLLLVIDQFEELFTPGYQDDRNAFIELLRVTADKQSDTLRIVITMRDDYLTRAQAECGAFYNLISDDESHHLIKVINSKDRFRDIITEPAKQNGVEFQEEAVDAILDDLLQGGSQANILPLLEYALTEIWKHREGRRITVQAVEKVGDVLDFLPDKAEAFYQSDKHSDDDRKTILRIFLNLANFLEVDADNLYSKSTQRWDSQPDSPEAKREWELIQTLAGDKDGYRFLNITYDDSDQDKKRPYVEVVHDILLTTWKTLRTELDRNIPFFIWNKETKNNAKAWLENGKDDKYLLSGGSLVKAEDYLNSARILDANVIEFINASRELKNRIEQTAYENELNNKKIKIKERRRNIFFATIAFICLGVLSVFLYKSLIDLNEIYQKSTAESSSAFLVSGNYTQAVRLAVKTLDQFDDFSSAPAQTALETLKSVSGEYIETTRIKSKEITDARYYAVSKSEQLVAIGNTKNIEIYSIKTRKILHSAKIEDGSNIYGFTFSLDEKYLYIISHNGNSRNIYRWGWKNTPQKIYSFSSTVLGSDIWGSAYFNFLEDGKNLIYLERGGNRPYQIKHFSVERNIFREVERGHIHCNGFSYFPQKSIYFCDAESGNLIKYSADGMLLEKYIFEGATSITVSQTGEAAIFLTKDGAYFGGLNDIENPQYLKKIDINTAELKTRPVIGESDHRARFFSYSGSYLVDLVTGHIIQRSSERGFKRYIYTLDRGLSVDRASYILDDEIHDFNTGEVLHKIPQLLFPEYGSNTKPRFISNQSIANIHSGIFSIFKKVQFPSLEFGVVSKHISVNEFEISKDGRYFAATEHHNNLIRIWDLKTKRLLMSIYGPKLIGNMKFNSEASEILVSTPSGVYIYDIKSGNLLYIVKSNELDVIDITYAEWLNDNRIIAYTRRAENNLWKDDRSGFDYASIPYFILQNFENNALDREEACTNIYSDKINEVNEIFPLYFLLKNCRLANIGYFEKISSTHDLTLRPLFTVGYSSVKLKSDNIINKYAFLNGENIKVASDYEAKSNLKIDLYCDFKQKSHTKDVSNCYIALSHMRGSLIKKIPTKNISTNDLVAIRISPDASKIYMENNGFSYYYSTTSGKLIHSGQLWGRLLYHQVFSSLDSQYAIFRKNKRAFVFNLNESDQGFYLLDNILPKEYNEQVRVVSFDDESDCILVQAVNGLLWLFPPKYFSEKDLYEYYKYFDIAEEDLAGLVSWLQ